MALFPDQKHRREFRSGIAKYFPDRSFQLLRAIIPVFEESTYAETTPVKEKVLSASFGPLGIVLSEVKPEFGEEYLRFQELLMVYWFGAASVLGPESYQNLKRECRSVNQVAAWLLKQVPPAKQ